MDGIQDVVEGKYIFNFEPPGRVSGGERGTII
jgi:hypothetical protein